jgi:molybdopterin-containing oxidoreductase family iron-sulfur binding subunit
MRPGPRCILPVGRFWETGKVANRSRRKFLRTFGFTLAGLAGLYVPSTASSASSVSFAVQGDAAQNAAVSGGNAGELKAGRWGMVIFTRKTAGVSERHKIIQACHEAHNVPDIPGRHAVKWIWNAGFTQGFAARQAPEELLNRRFLFLCNHCANPPCVRVCPTRASFKREDGLVLVDYGLCMGCRLCMSACPYGARSFNFCDPAPYLREIVPDFPVRERGVVEKCNFCAERLEAGLQPHCVEASEGAIIAGDLSDPESGVSQALKNNYSIRRNDPHRLDPNVHYIL